VPQLAVISKYHRRVGDIAQHASMKSRIGAIREADNAPGSLLHGLPLRGLTSDHISFVKP